jgi:2-polyprenyl-6-methoxyphenol hydroxylase-like FAD-dependent oxidoreductase
MAPDAPWPHNFVVAGDALCNFNPFYSQGMTVCAMQAEAMRQALRRGVRDARELQAVAAAQTETAWGAARSEDLRFDPSARPDLRVRVRQWYTARFAQAAGRRPDLAALSLSVSNFLSPPERLFSPGMISRVLLETLDPAVLRQDPAS